MNIEILQRAKEMISNGYDFGQIEYGMSWDNLMERGPYSDMYEAAESLSKEFGISVKDSLKFLKKAFDEFEPMDYNELNESKNYKNMKNVQRINESQLRAIVAESLKKVLKENVVETRYYIDIEWHGKDGRVYGDMGYNFCDFSDNYSTNLKECIEGIRETLLNPTEDDYDIKYTRSKGDPDPAVFLILKCELNTYDFNPHDGKVVYSIANCSEEVARQYGIHANEYIETYNDNYNWSNDLNENAKK